MTPKQVLQMIKDKGARLIDLKFIDLLGTWQHFSVPISEFKDEGPFEEGLGFDGSSIRGWQSIESSDMLVIPDPDSAVIDPISVRVVGEVALYLYSDTTPRARTRSPVFTGTPDPPSKTKIPSEVLGFESQLPSGSCRKNPLSLALP